MISEIKKKKISALSKIELLAFWSIFFMRESMKNINITVMVPIPTFLSI